MPYGTLTFHHFRNFTPNNFCIFAAEIFENQQIFII